MMISNIMLLKKMTIPLKIYRFKQIINSENVTRKLNKVMQLTLIMIFFPRNSLKYFYDKPYLKKITSITIFCVILEEWKPEVILAVGGFGNEYTSEMVPAAKGCALPNLTEKTTGN